MTVPCFFHFESCEPEDVIYRLDFKNNAENPEYMQMVCDFGWEYVAKCTGWLYFRKPASDAEFEEDEEEGGAGAGSPDSFPARVPGKYQLLKIFMA